MRGAAIIASVVFFALYVGPRIVWYAMTGQWMI